MNLLVGLHNLSVIDTNDIMRPNLTKWYDRALSLVTKATKKRSFACCLPVDYNDITMDNVLSRQVGGHRSAQTTERLSNGTYRWTVESVLSFHGRQLAVIHQRRQQVLVADCGRYCPTVCIELIDRRMPADFALIKCYVICSGWTRHVSVGLAWTGSFAPYKWTCWLIDWLTPCTNRMLRYIYIQYVKAHYRVMQMHRAPELRIITTRPHGVFLVYRERGIHRAMRAIV